MWTTARCSYSGSFYQVADAILEPKPLQAPRPVLYAGGESPAAQDLIARKCDAYLMHGDPPERIAAKVGGMRERREAVGLGPMTYGFAGYCVCRETEAAVRREVERITDVKQSPAGYANYEDWVQNTRLDQRVSVEDYSVSNRGLKAGLVGTSEQVADRFREFERAGADLVLLQFSPQLEEMERFAEEVLPLLR